MDVAASIIAFVQITSQIVNCIVTTGQLWDQVQNLPDDVQDMLSDMDAIRPLFQDIEEELRMGGLSHFRNEHSVAGSLNMARRAYKTLHDLIEDMKTQIDAKKGFKKKATILKIVIKKDKLERYQERLSRSSKLLQLALQAYQMALTRRSPELISRRVTTDLISYFDQAEQAKLRSTNEEKDDEGDEKALVMHSKTIQNRSRSHAPSKLGRFALQKRSNGAWQAYLQWPSWLSQSVCEIISRPSLAGWTYSYRVYNIIPRDSEIFKKIKNGDREGVLELFSSRKASPFDRDRSGKTLLHYAADKRSHELCRLLLNMGLQEALLESNDSAHEPILSKFVFWPNRSTSSKPDVAEPENRWERIVELFQSYMDDPESTMVLRLFDYIQGYCPSDDFVLNFRERFLPKFYTGPLTNRLEAFRFGVFRMTCNNALTKLLAQDQKITCHDVNLSTHEKLSLVHSAAIGLGLRYADEALTYRRPWPVWRVYHEGWSDIVQQVASVADDEDLHAIETIYPWKEYQVPVWKGSPLISVIGGVLCYITRGIPSFHWDKVIQKSIQQWVSDLKAGGVDLVKYGQGEISMIRNKTSGALDGDAFVSSKNQIRNSMIGEKPKFAPCARYGVPTESNLVPLRFLDLEAGPNPDDWRIVWAPEYEWMASEFWELIDKEEDVIMPGSWVES